jgi:hypothetical protein
MVRQHYSGHFRLGRVGRFARSLPRSGAARATIEEHLAGRAATRFPQYGTGDCGSRSEPRDGQVAALCRRRALKGRCYGRRRNNVIFRWQGNRNPVVDHSEWVQSIWGDGCQ